MRKNLRHGSESDLKNIRDLFLQDCLEEQVGDLEGKGFGAYIGAIAEDDDGEVVVRESDDVGVEAHGFAVVPHAWVDAPRIEEPAEAVGDGSTFGAVGIGGPARLSVNIYRCWEQSDGSEGGLYFFFAEKFGGSQRFIPFC